VSDPLYMLRCRGWSYFARYTVILITSHDCSHITWFRNSAFVSLLTILSHRTWVANDFSLSQLFQKRSKISDCTFWKFSYKWKIFFFTHLLYAKSTFNSDRELYKKKWCDQMRTWFNSHWKNRFIIWLSQIIVAKKQIDFHKLLSRRADRISQIAVARTSCWENSYSISRAARNWTKYFWLMILSDRQLSFDRWTRKLSRWILRSFFLWWSEFEYQCAWFVREIENFWSKQ
jgi:hypothetical protein